MTKRWKVYDGPHINPMFNGIVCMISATDRLIAVITEDETMVHPDTWPDVANQIAAAPDMLHALIAALPYIEAAEEDEAYKPGAVTKITATVRAAIDKAMIARPAAGGQP